MPLTAENPAPKYSEVYPARIKEVGVGSPAQLAGVAAGDDLLLMDGEGVTDILAYRHKLERGKVTLTVEKPGGVRLEFTVNWEDPGLEFEEVLFDGIKKCANKCDFCYIHQMPRGFRKSLYVMDDDYRLSFLYGSFVTLTNLSEFDVNRILEENLSPLYVSVHTTDQAARQDMMKWWKLKVKDEGATDIGAMIDRLSSIDLYTQIVLLPGRNDGEMFEQTLEYLSSRPNVISVAAVPVGLTNFRDNLAKVETFDREGARDVLRRANKWRKKLLEERWTRFIFPSDEFYLLAGEPLPSEEEYEGFPMLENGVGMIRDFLSEELDPAALDLVALEAPITPIKKVILATGTLFAPTLERSIEPLRTAYPDLSLEVRAIANKTFGDATTVAGLLTGRCFRHAVTPGEADVLIVPPTVLRYGTELLLDDVSLTDLSSELGMTVRSGGSTLGELARVIAGELSASSVHSSGPQFGFSTHAVKEARGQA